MRSSVTLRRPSAWRLLAWRPALLPLALCLAPALCGCAVFSPVPTNRGTIIESADYDKLVPGTTTKAEATALLGSPTSRATFDDNTWIYVSEITAPVPLSFPHVERQTVAVLNFDASGVLRNRRLLDKADAVRVAMAPGSTPSPGSETSFLQMVIGNVGRYSPLGALGGSGLGGGGLGNSENGYGHGGTGNTLNGR